MQNKFIALLLMTSVLCSPAFAQTADKVASNKTEPQPIAAQTLPQKASEPVALPIAPTAVKAVSTESANKVALPTPAKIDSKPTEPSTTKSADKQPTEKAPVAKPQTNLKPVNPANAPATEHKKVAAPTDKTAFPGLKKPAEQAKSAAQPQTAPASIESIQAENKRRLEEELKTTTLTGKDIVNFPNRSSLGSLELTTLPGINESNAEGPLPMAPSVSNKDMPSEQLLGRISPEVFQEMADIERGNTFLKLQMEKEKLKTDLEKLRATYRQQRLSEISKREDVVRTRIKWWQEQEKMRLDIEKKKLEEAALEREIAEQKENRERLRAEAAARKAAAPSQGKSKHEKKVEINVPALDELYVIESIRGLAGDLTAIVKDKSSGATFTVKKNDLLGSHYVIKEIKSDMITAAYGNRKDRLVFQVSSK